MSEKQNGIYLLKSIAIIFVIGVHVCNFSGVSGNFSWSPDTLNDGV